MTDADRYGRTLGKGFKAVHGVLCTASSQGEAPEYAARYLYNQLRKDIPGLKKKHAEVCASIELRNGLFGAEESLNTFERTSAGSLGEEHFNECVRVAIENDERPSRILERLVDRAFESLLDLVTHQIHYRDDIECHDAIRRHESQIRRELQQKLERHCGVDTLPAAPRRPAQSTEELLQFVIVQPQ
jgi:hypothetical protein